jgi:hypothetical protein
MKTLKLLTIVPTILALSLLFSAASVAVTRVRQIPIICLLTLLMLSGAPY